MNKMLWKIQCVANVTAASLVLLSALGFPADGHASTIPLADQPLFSGNAIPGNLLLATSVEFPTAITQSNFAAYSVNTAFSGYFDPGKCYTYYINSGDPNAPYFVPYGPADTNRNCTSTVRVDYTANYFLGFFVSASTPLVDTSKSLQLWSGNYLNWAATQTIDPFRSALTGGYRAVDTPTLTVLEKAVTSYPNPPYYQGNINANLPDRTLSGTNTITSLWGYSGVSAVSCNPTNVGGIYLLMPAATYFGSNLHYCETFTVVGTTPLPSNSWVSHIWQQGVSMAISNSNGTAPSSGWPMVSTYDPSIYLGSLYPSSPAVGGPNNTAAALKIRVKVCDPTVGLESNCIKYGSNYKPEGLIQNYAQTVRVGVMGYVNDPSNLRDGGVLRARMNYVGPTKTVPETGLRTTNPAAEWDASTGVFLTNPDWSDAAASTSQYGVPISNSGAINYLNKFGQYANLYKLEDPVSELYYAGIRYFKNQGNVSSYSSNLNAAMMDGFPVINSWDDPIQYSCQKNIILGIGDSNTNTDGNLPGSTVRIYEPAVPPEVAADITVNVTDATNKIGQMEGGVPSPLGSSILYWLNGDTHVSTYYIAGLAYDAHTVDMRPGSFKTSDNLDANGNKINTQTVTTYWIDVLEFSLYSPKSLYWLTAKYGGFDVPQGFQPYSAATTSIPAGWDGGATDAGYPGVTTPQPKPANYFAAYDASSIKAGLSKAFKSIGASVSKGSSQVNAGTLQYSSSGNQTYGAQYLASNWTGDVISYLTSVDNAGNFAPVPQWSAKLKLETQASGRGWDTNRIIATSSASGVAGAGVPFRASDLTLAQLTALASGGANQQSVLNYLRGDRDNEGKSGAGYRSRDYLLGDVVGSQVTVVGAPAAGYADASNPGYSSFRAANQSRPLTLYFGANDGMMHAVDGTNTGGSERFAYVPSLLFQGPGFTPSVDGLAALASTTYSHHFYVDSTPVVTDVDFNKAGGGSGAAPDWHSLLVGGLGKGGKGFYALDVTSPQSITTEAGLAGKVLWEFSDSAMGSSYGNPVVVKTKKYGWVVMLTSGYNNSDGVGRLYIVNPKTGALLETISTGAGSVSASAGLTFASGFVVDYTNYTVDAIYAGDLLGNLWRFDMTPASGAYSAPVKLATLTADDGSAQPVTTRPLIEVDPATLKRYVLVGTGRLLANSDISNGQMQTFYAIIDGTRAAFNSSITSPLSRSRLTANSNLASGLPSSTSAGWYYDLPHSGRDSLGNTVAERIDVMPTANSGVVGWAGDVPSGSVCNPSGTYYIYAVNFATGKTLLTNGTFVTGSGKVTDLSFVNASGTVRLEAGVDNKTIINVDGNFGAGQALRTLNWREVVW